MKKAFFLSVFTTFIFVVRASVVSIDVATPGALNSALTGAGHTLRDITELTVTGKIDARDFKTLRDNLTNLSVLDISEATIEAYSGSGGPSIASSNYPANTIPEQAFFNLLAQKGKTTLTSVTLSQDTIGSMAFYACPELVSIHLKPGIKVIKSSAFAGIKSTNTVVNKLTNVILPASVDSIEANAFVNCPDMETFTFAATASLRTLNKGVIPIAKLTSVTIPASVTQVVTEAFVAFNGNIIVDEANPNYSSQGGVLYNKDKTNLIQSPKTLQSINIPGSVRIISEKAFYENTGLSVVSLPSAIDSVARDAFYGSAFTAINMDSKASLRVIGIAAFAACKNLTSFVLPASIRKIERNALSFNSALVDLYAYNPAPLSIETSVLEGIDRTACTLHVPENSVGLYQNADVWKTFENIKAITLPNRFFYTPLTLEFGGHKVYGLSPNGIYVTGNSAKGAFLWNLDNSDNDNFDIKYLTETKSSEANGVSDNAVVAGKYPQTIAGKNVTGAGVWADDSWTSLGLGLLSSGDIDFSGSNLPGINGISGDGKTIVGMSWTKNETAQVAPYAWTKTEAGTWEGLRWNAPSGGQGARILSVSGNGLVAGGWCVKPDNGGARSAIVWTSPTSYKVIGALSGECYHVSNNGKYAALVYGGNAAIYNIETEEITIIRENAECSGVSDNGTVIGFYNLPNSARKGFVWSEALGFVDFANFLSVYAKDVVLPDDADFSPDYPSFDVPMGISADGKTITGWKGQSALTTSAWALKLSKAITPYSRPQHFEAKVNVPARTKVDLTWERPESAENLTLTGYKIYRNNEVLITLDSDATSYVDDVAGTGFGYGGKVDYSLSALYEGDIETTKIEKRTVTIVDSYNIPFVDNFEYLDLELKYWTTAPKTSGNLWFIDTSYPNGYKDLSVTFTTLRQGTYSESLISKPLDAGNLEKVYVSYFLKIDILTETTDSLFVEVLNDLNGSDWVTIRKYPMAKTDWLWEEADLSSFVKGKLFKVRFRAAGTVADKLYVEVDNFQIRAEKEKGEAPKALQANKKDGKINLLWQDPAGSYSLTYSTLLPFQPVGNEGNSFIGANKFDPEDLEPYKDLKLTSLSTFIFQTKDITLETKLKLAVFEGNKRICDQDIPYFTANDWNTFTLDNPITIRTGEPLYIGLEVTQHQDIETPLYTDKSDIRKDGKSNLFSADGGKTWEKLSDYGLKHNWCIIGNVRSEETSGDERAASVWGYEVYRNSEKISPDILIYEQTFTDENPGSGTPRYFVKAFYAESAWSAPSEEVTASETGIQLVRNDKSITLLPNPVSNSFRITGFTGEARLAVYDLSGREQMNRMVKSGESVASGFLASGIYILKITTAEGIKEIKMIRN
jgi:hypothetical protein